jgi:hypothetical protein
LEQKIGESTREVLLIAFALAFLAIFTIYSLIPKKKLLHRSCAATAP